MDADSVWAAAARGGGVTVVTASGTGDGRTSADGDDQTVLTGGDDQTVAGEAQTGGAPPGDHALLAGGSAHGVAVIDAADSADALTPATPTALRVTPGALAALAAARAAAAAAAGEDASIASAAAPQPPAASRDGGGYRRRPLAEAENDSRVGDGDGADRGTGTITVGGAADNATAATAGAGVAANAAGRGGESRRARGGSGTGSTATAALGSRLVAGSAVGGGGGGDMEDIPVEELNRKAGGGGGKRRALASSRVKTSSGRVATSWRCKQPSLPHCCLAAQAHVQQIRRERVRKIKNQGAQTKPSECVHPNAIAYLHKKSVCQTSRAPVHQSSASIQAVYTDTSAPAHTHGLSSPRGGAWAPQENPKA